MGLPKPSKILPNMSSETSVFMISPVTWTVVSLLTPDVPLKTWATWMSPLISMTWPIRCSSPTLRRTISPMDTLGIPLRNMRGPATPCTAL